jgi:hypothetical protein
MANADGARGHGHGEDGSAELRAHEPPDVVEPTVLGSDVPSPATWGPVLGPGGEDLGDGLVPVEARGPADTLESQPSPGARRRRRPLSRTVHRRADSPPRGRPSVALPSPGGLLATGFVAGLVGLAVLLVAVLFSFDGAPPTARDHGRVATLSIPAWTNSSVAEWVAASARLQARLDRSAKRERAIALEKRELARRREHQRRPAPAPKSGSVTTQVAARPPAAAPAPDPWAGVSPAEREFTPGPWNLS